MAERRCTIEGCGREVQARGLCAPHYSSWYRRTRLKMVERQCRDCNRTITVRSDRPTRVCQPCQRSRAGTISAQKASARASQSRALVGPIVPTFSMIPRRHPVRLIAARQHKRPWFTILVSGPCAWCGKGFTQGTTHLDALPRYCSPRCAKNKYKANSSQPGGGWISPVERLAIYERDKWICQLCHEPIDRDADPRYGDWAPSLDHIHPVSHSLLPDHSPTNLRLTHRWCNAIRGDGTRPVGTLSA